MDIDIFVKRGRSYATLFANSWPALRWIANNIPEALCSSMAMLRAEFVEEFKGKIERDGLSVRLLEVLR